MESFLDVFFGFLFRKTDFYITMKDPEQRYGFPDGVSQQLITNNFNKYRNLVKKMEEQAEKNERQKVMKKQEEKKEVAEIEEQAKKAGSIKQGVPKKVGPPREIPKNQEAFQKIPESYNGAVRDRYSWSQNYDDIDILVPVATNIVKGHQVKVTISRKHLFVSIYNEEKEKMDVVIDDDLKYEILKDESMWSLEGGKNIQITLTKDTNFWWNSLLVREEEIDIQKISAERSMADMEDEELSLINKLQFDERQKRLGLPQSHELKVHEMLKKGWDAEGSPFKGQEFDPKMFNISPSGGE